MGKLSSLCPWAFCLQKQPFKVCYFRTSRLLYQLAQSHLDGSYPALLASLAKLDLLILDDWMRDPLTASEARDLLEVFDDRFGRVSTLVASQVPVADWFARLPDPTDRRFDPGPYHSQFLSAQSNRRFSTKNPGGRPHAVHLIYNVFTSVASLRSLDGMTGFSGRHGRIENRYCLVEQKPQLCPLL